MLQNISQGKAITLDQIKQAFQAANLPYYRNFSVKTDDDNFFAHAWIHYIKGLDNGNASVIKIWCPWSAEKTYAKIETYTKQHPGSSINFKQNVNPKEIYKNLTIKPGEIKIICEYTNHYLTNNTSMNYNTTKEMGFFLYCPSKTMSSNKQNYFNSVIIFSPKPGIFNENIR